MSNMEIVKIPIEQIKVNPKNPKLHNDNAILKSVKTFGIRQPIIVRPDGVDNYQIVAGHGRLTAFSAIGKTDIPCIVWNETDENVINAYMVADNSTVIGGGWDDESLSELMQQLDADTDIDMSVFGFDEMDLRELLGDDGSFDIVEDEPPEAPETAISKTGDLWTLGNHRLLCGDATKEEDVKRLMDGKKADVGFCDPPYNVGYEYNEHEDDMDSKEYLKFNKKWFSLLKSISESQIITPGRRNQPVWYNIEIPFTECCWIKTNAITRGKATKFACWEPIFFYNKPTQRKRTNDVFDFPIGMQKEVGDHTCPKPLKLIADIVDNYSENGQSITDLFGGSGTTLIASEQLNRICYMMEIDPHYCDVILQRYFNLTNISPIRDDGVKWTSLIKEE